MNRRALDAELRRTELEALHEWCALRGVDDWPQESRAALFLDLALDRYLARLPTGWRTRRKLRDAAGHFDIPLATLTKRYQRAGIDPGVRRFTGGGVVDLAAERRASLERQRLAS
jgi:hypothetical protein